MDEMTPEQMEESKKMVVDACVCKTCPTYLDCSEAIGYCFPSIGRSKCIKEEKGCICGGCPITEKMGLKHSYYSTRGSEKEQSGM